MSTARRRITIVAGIGAFIVLAVVALNWRQAYYWFVPEARFWGKWQLVHDAPTPEWVELFFFFHRDGSVILEHRPVDKTFAELQSDDVATLPIALLAFTPVSTFRVSGDVVTFERLRDLGQGGSFRYSEEGDFTVDGASEPASSAHALRQFVTNDQLRLHFDVLLFEDNVWTLRRLPETGDADE